MVRRPGDWTTIWATALSCNDRHQTDPVRANTSPCWKPRPAASPSSPSQGTGTLKCQTELWDHLQYQHYKLSGGLVRSRLIKSLLRYLGLRNYSGYPGEVNRLIIHSEFKAPIWTGQSRKIFHILSNYCLSYHTICLTLSPQTQT